MIRKPNKTSWAETGSGLASEPRFLPSTLPPFSWPLSRAASRSCPAHILRCRTAAMVPTLRQVGQRNRAVSPGCGPFGGGNDKLVHKWLDGVEPKLRE
jgi:hypothetical protein